MDEIDLDHQPFQTAAGLWVINCPDHDCDWVSPGQEFKDSARHRFLEHIEEKHEEI